MSMCTQYSDIFIVFLAILQCFDTVGARKSIRPVKVQRWGVGVVICLQRGADCFHMVQLMPLHPQTPSSVASVKSRLVLPFWYRLTQVVLEKRPLNGCSSSTLFKKILIFLVITMSFNTRSQGCIISSYRGQHIVKAWNAFLKIPYDTWVYIKNNCWQKTT